MALWKRGGEAGQGRQGEAVRTTNGRRTRTELFIAERERRGGREGGRGSGQRVRMEEGGGSRGRTLRREERSGEAASESRVIIRSGGGKGLSLSPLSLFLAPPSGAFRGKWMMREGGGEKERFALLRSGSLLIKQRLRHLPPTLSLSLMGGGEGGSLRLPLNEKGPSPSRTLASLCHYTVEAKGKRGSRGRGFAPPPPHGLAL